MVITKVLVHFCPPPPPYKFLSPLLISFFLSLPARLSFYLFLFYLVSGNRIEARQWIVARHLWCYNPLSCLTPFCKVKHDKIKFHEFFCVCNFFSFSPPLSLSLSLSLSPIPVSLPISLSPAPASLSFSLPSLSSPSPTPTHVSLFIFLSPLSLLLPLCGCLSLFHPLSVLLSSSLPPCLSFSVVLSLSLPLLSFFLSFSLTPCLSFYLCLSFSILSLSLSLSLLSHSHIFLSFSLSLSLSLFLFLQSLFLSLPLLSLFPSFLSPIPVVFLSFSHSSLPLYLCLTPVSPSPSLWFSLFHPYLSSYFSLSNRCLIFYILFSLSRQSLSLSLSLERKRT